MTPFTQHFVFEMNESLIQRCAICNEILSDYSGCVWPNGQEPPTGLPAGVVYIKKEKHYTQFLADLPEGEAVITCNVSKE